MRTDTETTRQITAGREGSRVVVAAQGTHESLGDCRRLGQQTVFIDCVKQRPLKARLTAVACEPSSDCDDLVVSGGRASLAPRAAVVTVVATADFEGTVVSKTIRVNMKWAGVVAFFVQDKLRTESILEGTSVEVCKSFPPPTTDPNAEREESPFDLGEDASERFPAIGVTVRQDGEQLPTRPGHRDNCVSFEPLRAGIVRAELTWLSDEPYDAVELEVRSADE